MIARFRAREANSALSCSTVVVSGDAASTRMKNSLLEGSPNCWLSTMYQPPLREEPETAWTMPTRSGKLMLSTIWRGAPDGGMSQLPGR